MPFESWKFLSLPPVPLILVVLIISLSSLAGAQDQNPHVCMNNGNYTINSTYAANLNTALSSLSTNITDGGFSNASVGQSPNRVNALALCRTDRTLDQCVTCVSTAADGLRRLCPNQIQAIIWYEYCTLRYSNEPIFGIPTYDPGSILINGQNVSVDPDRFTDDRTTLLDELRAVASNGSSAVKGGGGNRSTSGSETIYGLVQCTPDLTAEDCGDCLNRGAVNMRGYSSARGMRMLMPSCSIRYELYIFYNETRLQQLRVLLPPPAVSPPPPDYA